MSQPSNLAPSHTRGHRALLDRYCVTCHNQTLRTAGLTLDTPDVDDVSQDAEVWEKVVRKLRADAMPPAGMPRPDKQDSASLASYLETELDRSAANQPNPGRTAVRRLNRSEYTNAIRDLLALEIDGASLLPADESRFGFDNNGDVLTVSPLLFEGYLSAARKISRLAIGAKETPPVFEDYDVPKYLKQEERLDESLPFGSRGGVAIRHHFPLDGEYVLRVRLQKNSRHYIRGLGEPHQLDVRVDGARIRLFTIGGEKRGRSAGIISTAGMGDPAQEEYERTADQALEVRFPVAAGTRSVAVTFVNESAVPEEPLRQRMPQYDFTQYKGGEPAVSRVSIGGPFNARGLGETPSRQRIFTCRPAAPEDTQTCVREILSRLARRAYRRPVAESDLGTLLHFYQTGEKEGGFEAGIQAALERILVGPEFLFRVELDPVNLPPGEAYAISDLELASRLSFFLWSSIPDEKLLSMAEKGQLKDPAVLESQVLRMLDDPRSSALVGNFAGQWLQLRNLRLLIPDPEVFPYFDDDLRESFIRETELFFENLLREDRSVLDLLKADYTFVNARLAEHYKIPNIYGGHLRKVQLVDQARRGLLGQGSILTATSYANRTSPVIRGKWVLENVLGAPPPPPPPNVPELRDRGEDGRILSMREQMEKHRANPVCASCHARMDPIGFALENFDGIGRWRTTDAKTPIDASGVLADGTKFEGPDQLRKVLLSRGDEFVVTVAEKLLTYALGRGVEYYDLPAVRKIMREAAADDYRLSSMILSIIRSTPFQMRRSEAL